MPILETFFVPHPIFAIPEIGKEKESEFPATISSFNLIAKKIANLQPDTIIWISQHAESYADFFQVADGDVGLGSFKEYGTDEISFRMLYDKELAREISRECKALHFPGGIENSDEDSLDHGTMVPLYFVNREYRDFLSVRVGVSGKSLAEHYRFGQIIKSSVEKLNRKAVVIASGDLSHCQSRTSNIGYRPEGAIYDEQIMRILSKANFGELLSFNRFLLTEAVQCCHAPLTIMAGTLDREDVECLRLSHEVPFGTGYGFCCFAPKGENPSRAFLNLYQERERLIAKEKLEHADIYVRLARQAIETFIATKRKMTLSQSVLAQLKQKKSGVFVTIYREGELRGCIGTIKAKKKNIGEEIIANAVAAACKDDRFEPLTKEELDNLVIQVDIVTELIPILSINDLDARKFGVMVEWQDRHAVILPNLPGIDTPEKQIEVCKRKAGIPLYEDVDLYRFSTEHHE